MIEFGVQMSDMVTGPANDATDSMSKLAKSFLDVGPAADGMGGAMEGLAGAIDPVTLAAAAATIALGALAAAAYKGMELAVEAGEFKKNSLAAYSALTGSAEQGQKAYEVINELSKQLPESQVELAARAKKLLAAGLDPEQMKSALTAMSSAAAMGLESAPQALDKIIGLTKANQNKLKVTVKDLKNLGINESELAKALGIDPKNMQAAMASGLIAGQKGIDAITTILAKKGEGALAAKMSDLGTMWDKAKEGLVKLFDGVADTPGFKSFIAALKSLLNLFGDNQETAKSMKDGVTSGFGAMFGVASKVIAWMQIAFLTLAKYAVDFYIWLFPIAHAFKEWWVANDVATILSDTLSGLWMLTKLVYEATLVMAAPFILMGLLAVAAVTAIIGGLGWLVKKIDEWTGGLLKRAYNAASDFIAGFVLGLSDGAQDVSKTASKTGDIAVNAMKKSLDAHSPSRKMFEVGGYFTDGLTAGIKAGHDDVAKAATGTGSLAMASTENEANDNAASGSSSGGITVNVGGITINGVASNGETITLTEEAVALLFERLARQRGLVAA